jgi:dephospho-CoA kinase
MTEMLLGLTGLYCSGKNFVGSLLSEKGFRILDVDKLGHTALLNKKDMIAERFGKTVLTADGEIDRRTLGGCVFGKPEELDALEKIVHPEANRLTSEWIKENSDFPLVINAALLHKSSAFASLDAVIFVCAPYIVRMIRARKRDRLSLLEIKRRFKSQNFAIYYSWKTADIYYIDNWGEKFFPKLQRRGIEKRLDMILYAVRATRGIYGK